MVRYFGKIYGRVQGVGFRYYVSQSASQLDVTGYVRNVSDGTVEVEVQGPVGDVDVFLERVKKGSHFSRVEEISLKKMEVIEEPCKFTIIGDRYV